jgi:uncharacterized protein (TIGR02598 family)
MKRSFEIVRPNRRGFSLIEVTIALGIVAFCMIPIMGLVPIALKVSRQSMDRNIETRMVQSIRAQLLQAPFSTLTSTNFFFDADGMPLSAPAASSAYEVTATMQANTILPDNQEASYLKTTRLEIVNRNRHQTNSNSIHLPDNGF